MNRVLIAGVGNVLLGDDGVGPYVACLLQSRYTFPENVRVEDLGTPGLDLVVHLADADTILIIDCVDDGKPAGTVTVYRRPDIVRQGSSLRIDGHSPALTESLMIAEFAGEKKKQIAVIGISGKPVDGVELSEAVRAALEPAIETALKQLESWGVLWQRKQTVTPPQVWWETQVVAF
ncbi:MAG: hydrogenase maturation protease [Acidobacteriaceae bacterium]